MALGLRAARAQAIGDYEIGLKAYRGLKNEYAEWDKKYGGPYEFIQWSVDARDTFAADKKAVEESRQDKLRYYLSSRTRGYSGLKNAGLPDNSRPGRTHAENLKRELESNADLAAAQRRDPVFGDQELRS
jgi:hypothetical protein